MRPLTVKSVVALCDGRLLQGNSEESILEVSTDTRAIAEGSLFVALAGERFDAHDFIGKAAESGACACVVSRELSELPTVDCAVIQVDDALAGLQRLAAEYRKEMLADVRVVGVTGSNGKTSTKDFLDSVLRRKFEVNKTQGNLNNHIGLPLTVLRTGPDHSVGVWEMGMSNPGEIAPLAAIAQPNAAVITNVGTAHIEFMKTREAIALEKGRLAEAVPSDGLVVLCANDDYSDFIRERCSARVIMAGIGAGDLSAGDIVQGESGSEFTITAGETNIKARIPVIGRHMVSNALLAAAIGIDFGLSWEEVVEGLGSTQLTGGRLTTEEYGGVKYIDDSYNANPSSMKAALDTLSGFPTQGKRVAVLGKMAELGELADSEHRALGNAVSEAGVDLLLTVGDWGEIVCESVNNGTEAHHFQAHKLCASFLREHTNPGDVVLVKGSRSAAMEKIIKEVQVL